MMKIAKKTIVRILIFFIAFLLLLALSVPLVLYIGYITYSYERWSPSPSSQLSDDELIQVLQKGENMTDEDYDLLYRQTGLTKIGIKRVLDTGGIYDIFRYRNSYFQEYEIRQDPFSVLCSSAYIDSYSDIVPLRTGDILVTSATNFSMWDTGHAALVVDGKRGLVLEAVSPESGSEIAGSYDFHTRPDFMVLRLKGDDDIAEQIVEYAKAELIGIAYDPTVGVLSLKNPDKLTRTQCSHIVWYAFAKFGIDIDADGGAVVSPKDIANSDKLEVVQVFGFDPDKLWN